MQTTREFDRFKTANARQKERRAIPAFQTALASAMLSRGIVKIDVTVRAAPTIRNVGLVF
jgi:hypothetical protein